VQRYLAECKPNQVLVSLAPSSLFDEEALADALATRPGRGLVRQHGARPAGPGPAAARIDNLQVTPRVASTTRESRIRRAWAVAQRMDEILQARPRCDFTSTTPGALAGLEDDPAPA
jgi:D-3-phosphoglycerate dehydrogenase